jgi:phosphate transport system substrate-binding protein
MLKLLSKKTLGLAMVGVMSVGLLAGCGGGAQQSGQNTGGEKAASQLTGTVKADGSSTVAPITEAAAEEFQNVNPGVQVTSATSGTGGGFKKFVVGETDINNASRPIKDKEKATAEQNKIEYVEFTVANDGLSIVVNKENNWVDNITVEELKKIWEPNSKVKKWSDVRPNWPNEEIKLYGPGTDSGTFDYFTEAIVGKEDASRSDYTASEDDNVLVKGIEGDKNSLGYFGYAYYVENKDKLKVVPVVGKDGKAVTPSDETIKHGEYKPLSRPLFIYVNKKSLERPEVKAFVKFYLENGAKLASEVGYTPLKDEQYKESLAKLQ